MQTETSGVNEIQLMQKCKKFKGSLGAGAENLKEHRKRLKVLFLGCTANLAARLAHCGFLPQRQRPVSALLLCRSTQSKFETALSTLSPRLLRSKILLEQLKSGTLMN